MSVKPIPPKTEAKLGVAQRCLLAMEQGTESTDTFRQEVANFLTAARWVKDVLINELAAGDKQIKQRIGPLVAHAMRSDADMVQDTFERYLRKPPAPRSERQLHHWLRLAMSHLRVDVWRREQKRSALGHYGKGHHPQWHVAAGGSPNAARVSVGSDRDLASPRRAEGGVRERCGRR